MYVEGDVCTLCYDMPKQLMKETLSYVSTLVHCLMICCSVCIVVSEFVIA